MAGLGHSFFLDGGFQKGLGPKMPPRWHQVVQDSPQLAQKGGILYEGSRKGLYL